VPQRGDHKAGTSPGAELPAPAPAQQIALEACVSDQEIERLAAALAALLAAYWRSRAAPDQPTGGPSLCR